MTDYNNLKGLGGWLILVGIGVVFSPLRIARDFVPLYYGIFTDGSFEILTTPGTEVYHQMWGPLLVFELIFNSLMIIASSYLVYLFFSKHYLFPKFFIAIVLVSFVFIPIDAWLYSFISPDEPIFDPSTIKELTRTVVSLLIWVPYMYTSKRVKVTFVEKIPHKSS